MKVVDISNYDYNVDVKNPDTWVGSLQAAGVVAAIIGSQDMTKARWQLEKCNEGGLEVIATYAEPNFHDAITLALEANCNNVCLVSEPGGIQSLSIMHEAVDAVRNAGLVPKLYGNKGDIKALVGDSLELSDIELWFAAYYNDHHIVTEVDFNQFILWGHQYTSTEYIAGKNRDMSEIFEEPMTPTERKMLQDVYDAIIGRNNNTDTGQPNLDRWNEQGNSLLLGYQEEQKKLATHTHDATTGGPNFA